MNNNTYSVVLGYLDNDTLPLELRRLGLQHRSAILLSPKPDEGTEPELNRKLYLAMLEIAFDAASATEAEVLLLDGGETKRVSDVAALKRLFTSLPEPTEPFPEVLFVAGTSPTAALISEPYAHVGGPSPYHDTYTVSLFADDDCCRRFVAALEAAAGTKPEQVVQGLVGPNNAKWARFTNRVLSVLGVRPAGDPKSVLARSWSKSRAASY